jgi:hypothetical protein
MAVKTLTATGTFPNGTAQTVTLTVLQSSIDDLISHDNLMPLNMLIEGDLTDIGLTKVVIKKVKNDEDAITVLQVDPAAPVLLGKFNAMVGPDGNGIPDSKSYLTRHGVKIVVTGDNNSGGGLPITAVIAVLNQGMVPEKHMALDPAKGTPGDDNAKKGLAKGAIDSGGGKDMKQKELGG